MANSDSQLELFPHNDQRDNSAKGEVDRVLFAEIAGWAGYYRDQVNDTLEDRSNENLEAFLTARLEDLKNMDPLVGLMLELEDADPEAEPVSVGSYRLSKPKIKWLNDTALGPKETNALLRRFQIAINAVFVGDIKFLNIYFKGGRFVGDVRLKEFDGSETTTISIEATNEAVRRFYLTAIRTLEGLEGDECTAGKLTALRNALNDDQASLKEPAELSYGISDLEEHTPEAGYMALMEAEQAANINKLRRESQHGPERDNLQEYSDLHLFSDLARAQRTLQKDMIVDGKIRPNWTKFYYLDDKGYVRMQAAALVAYRKFSGDYSTLSDRNAEKFTYFGKYYDAINVIDVIKVPYTDAYEKRVEKVVGLIKKIQDCLNEAPTKGFVTMSESQALKTARQKHLLTLIGQAIAELEVDMKDQGQGLTKTKAAFIKALCAGGAKAITFADICGFGAINTQEMEADVIEIFEELGLNFAEMKSAANDEWADHVESQIASADPIKLKELRKKMCDEGSEFIRGTEIDLDKKLNSGDGCSDASGGDELNRVDKIDDLEKAADAFADRARAIIDEDKLPVRIATVFTDLDFSKGPVETMRAKIIQLISFIKWGEDMHSNLKAANNSDYNDSIRTKREKMVA